MTESDIEEAIRQMEEIDAPIIINKILSPHKYKNIHVLDRPSIPVHDEDNEYIKSFFWIDYLCVNDFNRYYNVVTTNYHKSYEIRRSLKLQILTLLRKKHINDILL